MSKKIKKPIFETLQIREDHLSNVLWNISKFSVALSCDISQSGRGYVCFWRKPKPHDILTYWYDEKRVEYSILDGTDLEFWAVYGICAMNDLKFEEVFYDDDN